MFPLTPYIDLYRNLNPHLHETRDKEASPVPVRITTDVRNGLHIENDVETIRENLRRVFGFKDTLYSRHEFYSVAQTGTLRKPTILSTQVLLDVNYRWSGEYYHFFTEVLPNAMYLAAKYPTAPILCKKSKFTEGLFRWFGIQSAIVEHVPPLHSRALALFAQCGNPSGETIALLRRVVESKLAFETTTGILIRRHGTRFVENEEELFDQCKRVFPSLDWVIFDHLSPEDTARLFSKAAVIVAPHGAGLTNMLFASKGIAIYEFMPIDEPNICYWHLSEILGNTYAMIPTPCDPDTRSMKCKLPETLE